MIIEINPLDTLFFRDGKPFTMGEDTWADAIFPPSPSVIYGALRSAYFANHIGKFQKLKNENNLDVKGEDPTLNLKIKSIYLKINDEIFFPIPLDLVKKKNEENKALKIHNKKSEFISNSKVQQHLIYSNDENIENIKDGILNDLDFTEYLNLKSKEFYYLKLSDYLISEPKVGIARSSNTHTTEEGKLYRVDMKRLAKDNNQISMVVDFDNLDIPKQGLLKLGGEGKSAKYQKINTQLEIDFPEFAENETQFKLVLTSPAIFENGWIPKWIKKDSLEGEYNGLKLKLITAVIGKPVHIGGFDMKKRMPKPMYKAVPAGSVYYFELDENGKMDEVREKFHNKNISDIYPEQGFGHCYVGKV